MDWARAKTILIICLFAVNIFLFGTYMVKENESREEKARLRSEVCKVIEQQGITVEEDSIPDDSLEIRHATVKVQEDTAALAKVIFGEVTETAGQDNVVYSGNNGNIMFFDDSFSLVYESGSEIRGEEDAVLLAADLASKLCFETDEKEFRAEVSDGGYSVIIPQIFSGMKIFGAEVELKISSSGSVLGNGRFIGHGRLLRAEGETLEVSALLLDFADIIKGMGKDNTKILQIEYGYFAKHNTAGAAYLVPTLKVMTDAGDFHINMEDGSLIQLN